LRNRTTLFATLASALLLIGLASCGGAGNGGPSARTILHIDDLELPIDKALVVVTTKSGSGVNSLNSSNLSQLGCNSYNPTPTHLVVYLSYALRDTVLVDAAEIPQDSDSFSTAMFAPEGEARVYALILQRRSSSSSVVLRGMVLPQPVAVVGGTVMEIELDLGQLSDITLEWVSADGSERRAWKDGPYPYSFARLDPVPSETFPDVGVRKVVNLPWPLNDPRGPDGGWENLSGTEFAASNNLLPIHFSKDAMSNSSLDTDNPSPWSYNRTFTIAGNGYGFTGASLAFPGQHFITADAVCWPVHSLSIPSR
jgi:hypothetical protein